MLSKQDRWNRVEKRPVHFEGIFFITRRTIMLDIKQIRNQFDEVEAKLKTRGVASEKLYELRDFDAKRRELIIETEQLKNNVMRRLTPLALPNATKKMLALQSHRCRKCQVTSKHLTLS
jgi:seryl-tRNA synthetase